MNEKNKKQNIIIIFCDDLGYGDLGCYGSELNKTPRLDRMAAEGMLFTDFYAASSVCSPSRAGLMTGCYPKRVGLAKGESHCVLLPGDSIGLNPNEVTIPKMLKKQGYRTKLIGKWHLGDQEPFFPTNNGFDSYFGLPYSNDMLPDNPPKPWREQLFPPLPIMRQDKVIDIDPNQASLTDIYLKEAANFIQDNKDNPFFLYFSHMYVHVPIYAPYKYLEHSNNGPYGAAVEHIDHCTGVILDTLRDLELTENTLVVFTSDNGSDCKNGGSNAPLRGTKGTSWEGGFREPCIMHWPGTIEAGSTCSAITTTMDLLPTFNGLCCDDSLGENSVDGKDILPILRGCQEEGTRYEAFFYYQENTLTAVRSGRWKLFVIDEPRLYDLKSDIGETNNLYPNYPDVVKELSQYANKCRKDLGDAAQAIEGQNCRKAGWVESPVALTSLKWEHPYLRAEYDLEDII